MRLGGKKGVDNSELKRKQKIFEEIYAWGSSRIVIPHPKYQIHPLLYSDALY